MITQMKDADWQRGDKRVVAIAMRNVYIEWYEKLDTPEGEKITCTTVNSRNKMRKDLGEILIIKDQNGDILMKEYYINL